MTSEHSTFYIEKSRLFPFAKYAIAFRAALMLREGDSLLIDAGTSLTPIAKVIKRMTYNYPDNTHFTIMTHNREAFDSLIDANAVARLNIFQTGGRYDKDLNASFGHQAESAYENFHPKWVFLGQSGIDADRGPFCHGNTEELSLKSIIFCKPAFSRVIISDFTKLGIPGGLSFGSSDKLTDNVEHCILLTNEPRDEFMHRKQDLAGLEEGDAFYYSKYERQVSILSETHKVIIIPVRYKTEVSGNGIRIELEGIWGPTHEQPEWMGISPGNWIEVEHSNESFDVTDMHIAPRKRNSSASIVSTQDSEAEEV